METLKRKIRSRYLQGIKKTNGRDIGLTWVFNFIFERAVLLNSFSLSGTKPHVLGSTFDMPSKPW